MKRSTTTQKHWRSLAQLEDSEKFQELAQNEFPEGIIEDNWSDSSRRRFLQVTGASVALASATSCSWQEETIAPFAERPEGRVPGKPRYFASSMDVGGVAQPLLVTSYDGRPTKIEGNPEHPSSMGATSSIVQGGTLEMYDPDRSKGVARYEGGVETESSWQEFGDWFRPLLAAHRRNKGKGLLVVSEAHASPAMDAARRNFEKHLPSAQWASYEPVHRDAETFGCFLAFGKNLRPVNDFAAAKVVVSLDSDALAGHPDHLRHARGFAANRRPEDGAMSRIYAAEARYTTTGAAADHRLPIRSSQVGAFLLAIEAELLDHHGLNLSESAELLAARPQGGFLASEKASTMVKAIAEDLASHRGQGLLVVGDNQPKDVHARAQRLNVLLGNEGKTVRFVETNSTNSLGAINGMASSMKSGTATTVVILGGNPAYNAPADLGLPGLLENAENVVHLSLYRDETSLRSGWHLPRAHWLESWGDGRSWDGTLTIRQPLMDPLYGGRSDLEFAEFLATGVWSKGLDLVKAANSSVVGGWRKLVQDGFAGGAAASVAVNARKLAVSATDDATMAAELANGSFEVEFNADSSLHDGRFANSGWLQELPDPMTKLTWDNAALMAKSTADALGVKHESMIKLEVSGRSLELPVYVMPGQAQGTVSLPLGYGRHAAGQVAGIAGIANDMADQNVDPVGFDTYQLRTFNASQVAGGAKVTDLGATYRLASTQDHHVIDDIGAKGRDERIPVLVREGTVDKWEQENDFAQHMVHHPPLKSLWEERTYESADHKWGMAIDLSTCLNCSGCTIACQSENNISVVGKEQVLKGREMHWIRMDRYFVGDIEDPKISSQPVGCQHCEMAPCEQVCPVAATTHSEEGLNDMIYNRCVGTRYCSNNCPYKVRRFNFHLYSESAQEEGNEVLKMVNNPEVTVRSRGVMEKCTFCVQRIHQGKAEARREERELKDGDITPACAQACPTNAITFGDLNDSASEVAKSHANPRSYELLGELNLDTRNRFLARIRNPHPSLASLEAPAGAPAGAHGEEVHHG